MGEGSRRKKLWRGEILAVIAVVVVAVAAVTSGTTGAAAAGVGVGVDGEESRFVP